MTIKGIILKKIKDNGWSIPKAAEEFDLPLPTLKNIIYGKGTANIATLKKLSSALKCSIDDLIGQSERKNPSNDVELLKKCLAALDSYTQEYKISLSKEESMKVMDNLYSLYLRKQEGGDIDHDTIGWIIDNI